jgi:hypothetical protein
LTNVLYVIEAYNNNELGSQKSIGLGGLLKMQPIVTGFDGIKNAVYQCKNK